MKVTYLNHSGFLVETKNCYYIFDYYKGALPQLDKSKPAILFCSHFHQDHFNPEIFKLLEQRGMNYQSVLAKDINKKKYPEGVKVTTAYHDKTYSLDYETEVCTLLSTDSGVAYLVKTTEGTIYHAGDLNDWFWEGEPDRENQQMTSRYRAEIDKLKNIPVDVSFVVLDPRQEAHYTDGMLYFLQTVDCNAVYPMHYWNEPEVIDRFLADYPQYQTRIRNTENAKGEEL